MEQKQVRLQEFLNRLNQAPRAESFEEAFQQIADILNAVEDELTDIPFDANNWQTDGRLYPPQWDSMRDVEGDARIKRFRNVAHNTFIGDNGSIEIQTTDEEHRVILSKPGSDGHSVWEQ